jgi:outer membrane protein
VKKNFLIIAAVISLLSVNLFAQKSTKVGYIDSQTILTQLPEAIAAQGKIQSAVTGIRSSIDSLSQVYQQAMADYQKQSSVMTPDKKKAAEQHIVSLENEYRTTSAKLQQGGEVAKLNSQLMQPVIDKITDAVKNVAKTEGIQVVLEKSDQLQTIWYADSTLDLTYKVLDKLRRGK